MRLHASSAKAVCLLLQKWLDMTERRQGLSQQYRIKLGWWKWQPKLELAAAIPILCRAAGLQRMGHHAIFALQAGAWDAYGS